MTTLTMDGFSRLVATQTVPQKKRIESIDLLRGIIMIIMALDHVRDYFHRDAFFYSPTDLTQTSVPLFFTRWITHFCAPIFIFLAGISAYLHGAKKTKRELSQYLFTRGLWLIFVELFIISLVLTFNPAYPMINLQVIWAIGFSMMALSLLIHLNRNWILGIAILLIAGHNVLDGIHIPGSGLTSFFWSFLHEPGNFSIGQRVVLVNYPIIPWIGVMALGYYFGTFFASRKDALYRRQSFLVIGFAAIALFIVLRVTNVYGDAAHWSVQKDGLFTVLSFLNVTKYPPSLLYVLITLGPALIFLALLERPLNSITAKITVFGRVPFFYYVLHRYLIHLLALIAAVMSNYRWTDMILPTAVNRVTALKGYGFGLTTVYLVWIALVLVLYPFCKWFDRYKRAHQLEKRWLTYC